MKRTNSHFYARRAFILSLLSFVAVAAAVTFGVSARRANREAALRTAAVADHKSASRPTNLSFRAQDKNPNAPNAAGITADLTDAFPDGDLNNKVNPGDIITYTATITSNGADPATGITYNASLDGAVNLVPNSVNVQPIALGEPYTAFGNVQISVANGATNLLANDCDPNPAGGACTNAGLTISVLGGDNSLPFAGTTAQSGQVTASASDGTFTYNPAPGYNGSDSFTYTVRDAGPDTIPGNADDLTDTATATITVGPTLIWFIDNSAPAGDGRLGTPFNSIAAFNAGASDEAGDIIFIYNGTGTYTGGITLLTSQKLIGQGFTLQTETGAPPAGSGTLPTAGSTPTIDNAGSNIITLGQNNTLRGFNTGNSGSAGSDISGTSFGTLTISALSLNGDGRALNLTTGTLAASVGGISVSNTGSLDGLTFNAVGGSLTVSGTTSMTNPGGDGIDISNAPAGHNFNFGTATISKNAAGAAVTLATNLGTTSFTSLAVTNSSGAGIITNAAGTVNVSAGSIGTTGTGVAASFTNTVLGLTFTSVTSNGGANGLIFSGGSGSFTTGTTTLQNNAGIGLLMSSTGVAANFGNTTVTSPSGDAVDLSLNTAAITFADLDMTPDPGLRGLDAQNNTNTITVTSGDITTSGAGTASAVFIDGPAGRTPINITFTSVTTAGVGSGSASISIVDASTTKFQVTGTTQINTRSGRGVFVDNTTATTIQFATVNIPNPSNAGGNAFHIEDTSSTVTVATATISDSTVTAGQTDPGTDNIPDTDGDGDAIFLRGNTGNFTLSGGSLTNCGNDCIDGRTVTNLTINNVTINAPGQDAGGQGLGGHGISLINVSGTNNFDELLIQQFGRSQTDGFRAINTNINCTINITDGRFENTFLPAAASAGNDGLFMENRGSSNMTLLVDEVNNTSKFKGLFGEGIQVSTGFPSTGTANVTVTDTEFVDAHLGSVQNDSGHNGLRAHAVGNGDIVVNFQNNTFTNVAVPLFQQGVISLFTNDNASLKGNVINNTITNATQPGIQLFSDNAAGQTITEIDVNLQSNTINNTSAHGILVNIGAAGSISEANIRINSNTIGQTTPVGDGEVLFGFGGGPNSSAEGVRIETFGAAKTVNVKMNSNYVRQNAFGVDAAFPGPANEALQIAASSNVTLNATVTTNQLLQLDDITNGAAFFGQTFAGVPVGSPTMCLDFTGNTGNTNVDFFLTESAGNFMIENVAGVVAANTGVWNPVNPSASGYANSGGCTEPPAAVALKYDRHKDQQNLNGYQTPQSTMAMAAALATEAQVAAAQPVATNVEQPAPTKAAQPVNASPASETTKRAKEKTYSHHAQFKRSQSMKASAADKQPLAPEAGTIGPITIGTLAPGDSVIVTYQAQVISPPTARQTSHQATVSGSNFANVLTNDPATGAPNDPTITVIDVLSIWVGGISIDWNDPLNWNPNTYAPGVSNPAVNDVEIHSVGLQPTIGVSDISIYSLLVSTAKVLTITNPRVLTIGAAVAGPGGNLQLDGDISGGNLNLGTGTHNINSTGGILSSTNVATVLSGSTVTLTSNLQAGALAVNAGGSMNITNRTLSLNGSGAALTVPGGATFTTAGSTVQFNGTAAQQAAGIAYNNLTINNTIDPSPAHITGVTLTGNASVAGVLTLTSSDLATGAFTLTMPVGATSGPASGATDVVGNVKRTGFVAGGTALSFGNPFNTIRINSGAVPADINILIAKNPPATYAGAVKRSYTITPNGAHGPATLRLHYRNAELNGNSETPTGNFNFRKGPSWNAVIPTSRNVGVPEDNWLENSAVTSFSEWTFANLVPTASGGVVTGRITDGNGAPVEGAVVRLSGTQNRKFITDANGVYRFDNVETNGFYNVTPSRVNYTFSPAVISFSQLGETTEAAFGASATGGSDNPLDTPEYFARQNYLDFLGREPDEAGFNFWSDQILGCGGDTDCMDLKRTHVSAAFFLSIEFQETGGLVDGFYRASFGRRPSYGEFKPDAASVAPGLVVGDAGWEAVLGNGKAAFADAFVQRAAFQTAYGSLSNDAYVDALIANTGVSFTGTDRSALVSSLGNGMTRAQVLRAIVENPNVVAAKRNEAFVMMEYFGYLRRDPDASGYLFWLTKLNEFNGNFVQAEMVRSFIVSGEYRQRFPR